MKLKEELMNIWNKIYSFFYSIPFGMKAAEDEVMLSKVDASSVDTGIHQQISQQRVGQDLLKGEVTQEVEELRYRDYKVYRESKHYKPIGDEMVKVENIKNDIFHQCNEFICHGTDGNEDDQFRIKIEYEYLSRFKIEKCIQSVSVNMNPSKMEIVLNVDSNTTLDNIHHRLFVSELKRIIELEEQGLMVQSEIYDNIKKLSFITYKAVNEDDFIRYSFYTLRGMMVEKTDTQFRVHFQLASYEREDLTEKFFSESMEKKYENKEAKKRELRQYVQEVERTRRCDECGKEINVWDGDITEASIGKALCHDCLLKHLNNLYVS